MRGASFSFFVVVASLASGGPVRAQDDTPASDASTSMQEDAEARARLLLDDAPIISPRATAMGGALSTTADDLDAAFLNPAGIGGLNWGKQKTPWVRKLYLPWFGAAINENTRDLNSQFKGTEAQNDDSVGKAIIDANAGKRQYGRVSSLAGIVLGRTMLVPFYDNQVAMNGKGEGSNALELKNRTTTGAGYGFSAQDGGGHFAIGYFGYIANRSEMSGEFSYDDLIDKQTRTDLTKDNTFKYTATGHNAGLIWRLAKTGSPTLAVAAKNLGGTTYKPRSESGGEDVVVTQDLTIGFSIAPEIGRTGRFTLLLEAQRVEDPDVTIAKKLRAGTELTLFGIGSYALIGIRGGLNDAGVSAGASLNLGLIAAEAAMQSVNIGLGNEKVIEKRFVGTVFVNVADF